MHKLELFGSLDLVVPVVQEGPGLKGLLPQQHVRGLGKVVQDPILFHVHEGIGDLLVLGKLDVEVEASYTNSKVLVTDLNSQY